MTDLVYTVIGYRLASDDGEILSPVIAENAMDAMAGVWEAALGGIASDYQPVAVVRSGSVEVAGLWQEWPEDWKPHFGAPEKFTVVSFDIALGRSDFLVIEAAHWADAVAASMRGRDHRHYRPVAALKGEIRVSYEDTWQALITGPVSASQGHYGRRYRRVIQRLAMDERRPFLEVDGRTYFRTPTGELGPRVRRKGGWVKPGSR